MARAGSGRYCGLRAYTKYIGVKIPRRPDVTIAVAHKFRSLDTRTVPLGTIPSASMSCNVQCVAMRPAFELRKLAKENREPARGWYQGMPGPRLLSQIYGIQQLEPDLPQCVVDLLRKGDVRQRGADFEIGLYLLVPRIVGIEAAGETVLIRCEASARLEHPEHFTVTVNLGRRMDSGLDREGGVE